jgi:hypothetical protein
MLAELVQSLSNSGIEVRCAEMKDPVKDKLIRFELFERFGTVTSTRRSAARWTPISQSTRSTGSRRCAGERFPILTISSVSSVFATFRI